MKFTQHKVSAMVRSVLRGGKQFGEHHLIHPQRDWFIGVVVCVVVCVVGAIVAALMYRSYETIVVKQENEVVGDQVYRAAIVGEALAILNDRAATYESLQATLVANRVMGAVLPAVEETADIDSDIIPDQLDEDFSDSDGEVTLDEGESVPGAVTR